MLQIVSRTRSSCCSFTNEISMAQPCINGATFKKVPENCVVLAIGALLEETLLCSFLSPSTNCYLHLPAELTGRRSASTCLLLQIISLINSMFLRFEPPFLSSLPSLSNFFGKNFKLFLEQKRAEESRRRRRKTGSRRQAELGQPKEELCDWTVRLLLG